MKKFSLWFSLIAVVASFAGGFLLANRLNKSEIDRIKSQNADSAKNENTAGQNVESDLTNDEISRKLADADDNAGDFDYQKKLGIALSQYAAAKNDFKVLKDTEKILLRADQLKKQDLDVLNALGNLNFDLGYHEKSNERLAMARDFYGQIIEKNPADYSAKTDSAITFYLQTPPDYETAARELKASLKIKPDNQKTLQFLIQTYLKMGKTDEAAGILEKLKTIDPQTPSLKEIATQLAQSESNDAK